jgi:hypothetical protein
VDDLEDKKSGLKVMTLNRHSQPRLPGSVVGDASMRDRDASNKITKVSARKLLLREQIKEGIDPVKGRLFSPKRGQNHHTGVSREFPKQLRTDNWELAYYFVATSECVIACTDNAIRFCTPTLRINFATCAFTVRSSIPN